MQQDSLVDMAKPLAEYLKEYHPHTAIIITTERVTMVEDLLSIPFVNHGSQGGEKND